MTEKTGQPRQTQQFGDLFAQGSTRNGVHDELSFWLLDNWKAVCRSVVDWKEPKVHIPAGGRTWWEPGKVRLEIFIEGSPPAFVDAIGSIDLMTIDPDRPAEWKDQPMRHELSKVVVEIKPEVSNFGAVLRQILFYAHRTKAIPVLLTPDRRYDARFLSQGVLVVHP